MEFVHGILQARILEWVAFPFSGGNLPKPGIEARPLALQADPLPVEPQGQPKLGDTNTQKTQPSFLLTSFPFLLYSIY